MMQFMTSTIRKVVFHGYRKTRAWPVFMEIAYEHGDEIDMFQDCLAELSGKPTDNHTVYEVWHGESDADRVCYWFSDWHLYIALRIDNIPY